MYKFFYALLTIFWILDICDFSFMEIFDTTYPINTGFWFLIWMLIPAASTNKGE